jgi:hypothetical protein
MKAVLCKPSRQEPFFFSRFFPLAFGTNRPKRPIMRPQQHSFKKGSYGKHAPTPGSTLPKAMQEELDEQGSFFFFPYQLPRLVITYDSNRER